MMKYRSHEEVVKEKIRQLQKSSDIDDTLEHSRQGIGQDTEYGWDKVRAEAGKRSKENFVDWLEGVIRLLSADIEENPDYESIDQWKKYLKTLKSIRHKLTKGRGRTKPREID